MSCDLRPVTCDYSKERSVSHYTIDELIARWKQEELSTDQMIGQLLLLLKEIDRRLKDLRQESCRKAGAPAERQR